MPDADAVVTHFADFNLPAELNQAIADVGYQTPSQIQARTIPALLAGNDLIGQAPTGTGKTAAFVLPLLARLDVARREVQVLVITPTRELAGQVSEAISRYASHMQGVRVASLYGGQQYGRQIGQLRDGVHVVVGTPGRLMDHVRRGTLQLGALTALVLDEADEMLRMGFIDDVEWILEHLPSERQMVLFSATMPTAIARIARKHMRNPDEVSVQSDTAAAETIRQRYWLATGLNKLDALTRLLEVEPVDAMLVFVRTRVATTELAASLRTLGYATGAINGDMAQADRERTITRLKEGKLQVLVATDVAARGLDVERISHVINYHIPFDTEAYIHRIGRTGRAGRTGEAILFVAPREKRLLAGIERATRGKLARLELPTVEMVNNARVERFRARIREHLQSEELGHMREVLEAFQQDEAIDPLDLAAALALMGPGKHSIRYEEAPGGGHAFEDDRSSKAPAKGRGFDKQERKHDGRRERRQEGGPEDKRDGKPARPRTLAPGMERFRIEVGRRHEVKPSNIVGAIANEAGLDGEHIGHIDIREDHSLVDLPQGMPGEIFAGLKRTRVCGQALAISRPGKPKHGKKESRQKRRKKRDRLAAA